LVIKEHKKIASVNNILLQKEKDINNKQPVYLKSSVLFLEEIKKNKII